MKPFMKFVQENFSFNLGCLHSQRQTTYSQKKIIEIRQLTNEGSGFVYIHSLATVFTRS